MATSKRRWTIRKLDRTHIVDAFDCGYEDLNRYISRFALNNQSAGSARTYVAIADSQVVGYYSLAVGAVAHSQAPARCKGLIIPSP